VAEPDHTATARLSGLPDSLFAHLPGVPPDAADKDEKALEALRRGIAGIGEVKAVITCLLADSDAFREVLKSELLVLPHAWPLSASSYAHLLAGIHFLDTCSRMYQRELHR
jgi:hypothetical protein